MIDIFLFAVFISLVFIASAINIDKNILNTSNLYFVAAAILATHFYTARQKPSTDAEMYYQAYLVVSDYEGYAWGRVFFFYQKILSELNLGFDAYTKLSIIILLALIFFTIKKLINSNKSSYLLLTYVLSFEFFDLVTNVYRQAVAGVFLVWFFYFVKSGNLVGGLIVGWVAYSIHWSALLVSLMIFSSRFIFRRKMVLLVGSYVAIFLIIYSVITSRGFPLVADNFLNIVSFIGFDDIINEEKINAYIGGGVDGAFFGSLGFLGRVRSIGVYSIPIICSIFLHHKFRIFCDEGFSILYSCYLVVVFYALLVIDSAWYFRNFYWAFLFLPPLMMDIFKVLGKNRCGAWYTYFSIGYSFYAIFVLWISQNLVKSSPKFF